MPKLEAAIQQLDASVNQVNAVISSLLAAADGQPLIDDANVVLAALGG
ncbi:MAG TPA: hypothetical protein VFR47_32475 [Anaerolineales bacterium]|nr:hypothetical protein [Anaerolineales bacterium]